MDAWEVFCISFSVFIAGLFFGGIMGWKSATSITAADTAKVHEADTPETPNPEAADDQIICRLTILPGREVFSPEHLPAGVPLKLIFIGNCWVRQKYSNPWKGIDALYAADQSQNFTLRHQRLHINSQAFTHTPLEEDRSAHRYVLPFESKGGRLAILINSPIDNTYTSFADLEFQGEIVVTVIRNIPVEEPVCDPEIIEQQKAEELKQVAREWSSRVHLERNVLDPEYQAQYAKRYMNHILSKLRYEWLEDYRTVTGNEKLHTLLQAEYSDVLSYLEARLEIVRIAQRLEVQSDPEPLPKETPEEYRHRTLSKKRMRVEDEKAEIMQGLELLQVFSEDLDNYPLDEDEKERLIQDFKYRLLSGEEETTDGHRQL